MSDLPAQTEKFQLFVDADDSADFSEIFLSEKLGVLPAGEKFVVFYLNGQPFGIRSGAIAEVSRPPAIAPVPNAPIWLSGITNLRGDIISVIDLPKLLQTAELVPAPKSKFIILRARDSEALISFMIDKPGEIIFITTDEIQETTGESTPYIFGQIPYAENFLKLINVEKLIDSLAFH